MPTPLRGCHWLMQRLRAVGADPRSQRRSHVLSLFHKLVECESDEFVAAFAQPVLEVCLRVVSASSHVADDQMDDGLRSVLTEAQTVLQVLERRLPTERYVGALNAVQTRLRRSKAFRKRQHAAQAVLDPKAFAEQKLRNTQRKKDSRKRKTREHMAFKGIKRRGSGSGSGGVR